MLSLKDVKIYPFNTFYRFFSLNPTRCRVEVLLITKTRVTLLFFCSNWLIKVHLFKVSISYVSSCFCSGINVANTKLPSFPTSHERLRLQKKLVQLYSSSRIPRCPSSSYSEPSAVHGWRLLSRQRRGFSVARGNHLSHVILIFSRSDTSKFL